MTNVQHILTLALTGCPPLACQPITSIVFGRMNEHTRNCLTSAAVPEITLRALRGSEYLDSVDYSCVLDQHARIHLCRGSNETEMPQKPEP